MTRIDKTIITIITLIVIYAIFNSDSMKVTSKELKTYENIDYCVSVYYWNQDVLEQNCDMEAVEAYINN